MMTVTETPVYCDAIQWRCNSNFAKVTGFLNSVREKLIQLIFDIVVRGVVAVLTCTSPGSVQTEAHCCSLQTGWKCRL